MKVFARYLPILAMALVLPACADSPTEADASKLRVQHSENGNGSDRYVFEEIYDWNDFITGVFCEDGTESEPILTRGKVVESWSISYLPNGNMAVQIKAMGVGLGGVGTISGAEYSIKEADHYVFHRVDDRESGTYRSVYRVESHDLKKSFRFSVKGTFRWADGDFIVNRERIREECNL